MAGLRVSKLPTWSVLVLALGLGVSCSGERARVESAPGQLSAESVPEGLRDLLPLAQRWGISDDLDRGAALERATEAEKQELRQAVRSNSAEITTWLDTFGSGADMSPEAVAFMYMQLAVEELPD